MGLFPSPQFRSGPALGPYAIRRKLGSGSLGTVYLVEDRKARRLVALKVLRTDRLSPDAVARLKVEFQAISGLHHPQIAAAYDFGYTAVGSLPYYTREYIAGSALRAAPGGHEAGAFTGADEAQPGLLESLSGGTLFLDEVNELPLAAQAKLLRVLDSRSVRRLGGTEERPVDVRFLASSSAELKALVAARTFRADLYHRLAQVEIHLPPLSLRREDIADLARHFVAKHARRLDRPEPVVEAAALRLLQDRAWPGKRAGAGGGPSPGDGGAIPGRDAAGGRPRIPSVRSG